MEFAAIDVETANADLSSICQVGIASFDEGQFRESWSTLINPRDEFDPIHTYIHGIDEDMVRYSPTWAKAFPEVEKRLRGKIVVSHTPFDRIAVTRACEYSRLTICECRWLDSARVVRRAWKRFARCGYGLSSVASHFNIEYRAHDATEDARCAGLIVLRAIEETGIQLEQWLSRAAQAIDPVKQTREREGNPDGELYGEVLVFTGSLSKPRNEAADVASSIGCRVDAGVTKHTTLLVVGDQDLRKLAGHEKSSKQLKAERLIEKGQPIRILGEADFTRLVLLANSQVI